MNYKIILLFPVFVILIICPVFAQKHFAVSVKDFKNLIGCWQGTLNYSGTIIRKPYTTTAELVIKQTGKLNQFGLVYIYTKDPRDNKYDTITISKNGRKINAETIKSKRYTREGNLKIITEITGFDHDYNKPAVIRTTYIIGKRRYTYKQEIQPEGQNEWVQRLEHQYLRKPCPQER
jgi:hypothetical protein